MYRPAHFDESRESVLHALVAAHPLATLVVLTADGLVANHLPLLLVPDADHGFVLHGHVARANPLWRQADPSVAALAVFQGPHAYVSPSWYPSKLSSGGKVVPTWNYAVVHAQGPLRIIQERAWLLAHIDAQTRTREAGRHLQWHVSDAPEAFIATLADSIVGIELAIHSLQGKWKLSQNRSVEDQQGVIDGLRGDAMQTPCGPDEVARLMATLGQVNDPPV